MHTSTKLRSKSFAIEVDGRAATIEDVLQGDGAVGRLGIVVREPFGAVGASNLLLAAITAFYDAHRASGEDFYIYPDYFLFHVGAPHGDHSMLDVWPAHKEVVVPDDPDAILQAINDRAITWLLVPEGAAGVTAAPSAAGAADAGGAAGAAGAAGAGGVAPRQREALASAHDRIASALSYSHGGRVTDGDVRIAGNDVTDSFVGAVLDPEAVLATFGDAADPYAVEIAQRAGEVAPEVRAQVRASRDDLRENGRPLETYRRLTLDRALGSLGSREGAG